LERSLLQSLWPLERWGAEVGTENPDEDVEDDRECSRGDDTEEM